MSTRRDFLKAASALPLFHITGFAAKATDVAIEHVEHSYEDFIYRVPIKFGGNIVDRVTLLNVNVTVKTKAGKTAKGFGSMPMGNVWSFPSKVMPYDVTLNAMREHAKVMEGIIRGYKEYGHPVDHGVAWEPHFVKAAPAIEKKLGLKEPIPLLCTLVTASPFDAAVHDAFGKLHGVSSYKTYGADFMTHDLSKYLGPKFKGEYLDKYVLRAPKGRMPMYHLVGAVDPLVAGDITKRVNDGLPETLPEWIQFNGLINLKIKLNGDDIKWDVERVVRVEKVTAETQAKRGVKSWVYSLDFNEKCPSVQYLLEFIKKVKEQAPAAYDRIQYVEQPTGRDLEKNKHNTMFEAAKLKPVVIDESLSEVSALYKAKGMGYTGAALKACKGQSQALLMGAAAQKEKMFLCVQDLTCPGASLVHSASLSAHIPGVAGIEANSRQYVPAANKGWEKKLPGLFIVKDGTMDTSGLVKPGLSAV